MVEEGPDRRDRHHAGAFEGILDALPCAVLLVANGGTIGFANAAAASLFRRAAAELVGVDIASLLSGGVASLEGAAARRGPCAMGGIVEGAAILLDARVARWTVADFDGFIVLADARPAAAASDEALTVVLETSADGIALFDGDRRLIACNGAHRGLYDLPRDRCRPGVPLETHFAADGALADLLSRDEPLSSRRIALASQRTVSVSRRVTASGEFVVATRSDGVGEGRAILSQRAERLRSLGELTGGVAHDFNNTLAVIIGNLELLTPMVTAGEGAAMLTEALDAAESGARLTDRLLAFARRQPLAVEPVDINAMVLDTVGLLKRTLGARIELTLDLAPSLPPVRVDRGQLESGLVNLAANARDAMANGGRLYIETSTAELDGDEEVDVPAGSFVRVGVSDTGVGMSEAVRSRAFEPFFTTKEKGRGTGLGLSSLFGYCRQIGGALTVYSEVGKGSTFNLYLPLSGDVAARSGPRASPSAAGTGALSGRTILVVEDDTRVRSTTVKRLHALGARVVEAVDAGDALARLDAGETVDAVFTDVVMPGALDGYGLARAIRERAPRMPILLTSGYAEDYVNAAEFAQAGLPLLRKPYRTANLERALASLFDTKT